MNSFNKIKPFRFWCQHVLPLVYDESLSYYELLCKVISYLNNMIGDFNDLGENFNELLALVNQLQEEFDNMDIQDEVNKKLDEMAADGTLSNLILPYIAESVAPSRKLIIARYGRLLDEFVKNDRDAIIHGQALAFYDGYYYTCGDVAHTTQTISVWDADGVLVKYERYTELYHANGLAVDANNIYVALQDASTSLAIIDKGTLEIKDIITFPELSNLYSVTNYNDAIYFVTTFTENNVQRTKLHLFDKETNTAEEIAIFNTPQGLVPQNFCIFNEKVYFLYVISNSIYKFDIKGGNQEYLFYIPAGDGLYPTGECEDLFVKDNDIYLAAIPYNRAPLVQGESTAAILQIFKMNIVNPLNKALDVDYMPYLTRESFICDGNAAYSFNPGSTVTTLEELSILAAYHKNAALIFQNTARGQLYLKNGNYVIIGNTGSRVMSSLQAQDCVIDFSVSGLLEKVHLLSCIFKGTNLYFGAILDVNRSFFEAIASNFSNVTSFSCNRSKVVIDTPTGGFNEALSGISPNYNMLEFFAAYQANILRFVQCITGTASSTSRDVLITLFKSRNNSIDDILQRSELINAVAGTKVSHDIANNANYSNIAFQNGVIYETPTGGSETELTTVTFVKITARR